MRVPSEAEKVAKNKELAKLARGAAEIAAKRGDWKAFVGYLVLAGTCEAWLRRRRL